MPRTGRPQKDDAKHHRITVRLNEDEFQDLQMVISLYDLSVAEAIRMGIAKLLEAKR